jgi:iron uptake system EfeUOB component EfeO/EfeM
MNPASMGSVSARAAACLLLLGLVACKQQSPEVASAQPQIPEVNVKVTDSACEPMTLTVHPGKTRFLIKNLSQRAVEWEILKGVYVVEERENIAPGFSQKLTARLEPGRYQMTCGLLSNPRGTLIVSAQ